MKTNNYNTMYPTMNSAIKNEIIIPLNNTNSYLYHALNSTITIKKNENELIEPLENTTSDTPVEDIWDIDNIADEAIELKTVYDENGTPLDYYQLKPIYNDNPYAFWALINKHTLSN